MRAQVQVMDFEELDCERKWAYFILIDLQKERERVGLLYSHRPTKRERKWAYFTLIGLSKERESGPTLLS